MSNPSPAYPSPVQGMDKTRAIVCTIFSSKMIAASKFAYLITGSQGQLNQESQNPSVYTKISCYLPWIAEQYGMEYEADENNIDPDCVTGTGDITEVTADVCTVIPTSYTSDRYSLIDPVEAGCLFPYTVDNTYLDGCTVSGIEDFTHPVFKCPIRSIKNRNTSYSTNYIQRTTDENGFTVYVQVNELINGVYCPTNSIGASNYDTGIVNDYIFNNDGPVFGPNGEYELDPENNLCRVCVDCSLGNGLPVFGTCKNNCRGGEI